MCRIDSSLLFSTVYPEVKKQGMRLLPASTYLPAFLPTYLPSQLPAFLPTYLPPYLTTIFPTYSPSFLLSSSTSFLSPFSPTCLPLTHIYYTQLPSLH